MCAGDFPGDEPQKTQILTFDDPLVVVDGARFSSLLVFKWLFGLSLERPWRGVDDLESP